MKLPFKNKNKTSSNEPYSKSMKKFNRKRIVSESLKFNKTKATVTIESIKLKKILIEFNMGNIKKLSKSEEEKLERRINRLVKVANARTERKIKTAINFGSEMSFFQGKDFYKTILELTLLAKEMQNKKMVSKDFLKNSGLLIE